MLQAIAKALKTLPRHAINERHNSIQMSNGLAHAMGADWWSSFSTHEVGTLDLAKLVAGIEYPTGLFDLACPFTEPNDYQLWPTPHESYAQFVSKDVTRLALNGVYMGQDGAICATDGHWGQYTLGWPDSSASGGYIVPAWAIKFANKFKAKLYLQDRLGKLVREDLGQLSITFELIYGPYPRFQNVIPSKFEHETTITLAQIKSLVGALPKVKALEPKTKRILGNGICEKHDLGCDLGLPANYAYNAELLSKILKDAIKPVRVRYNGPLSAHLLTVETKHGCFERLLMPLRIVEH